jgi:hypothetical protein
MLWRLILLMSLFVFAQLLGVLLYLRLSRLPSWLAHVIGVVGSTLVFFYLSPVFFFAGLREAQEMLRAIE